jgi:VanZ family protein
MSVHRSAAWPLSWVAVALVVYASLHPWSGWHWPDAQVFTWRLPKSHFEVARDMMANLLGYLPLGTVLCLAHLRSARGPLAAALLTLLAASALSYTLELIQFGLPTRVPSLADWLLNTLVAAWGALLAVTLHALGAVDVWHRLRQRWFIPQAGLGLALLGLWPLGLLFPPPLPLGEGQLLPHVRIVLVEATSGTPWQQWLLPSDPLTLWASVHSAVVASSWLPWVEGATVAMGLLAPLCLAGALARERGYRVTMMSLMVLLALSVTTFSTALNFGPDHAFTWVTLPSLTGLLGGATVGALLVTRSRRDCAALGVLVLLALLVLIHLAPQDPYYAQTLQTWENGRFIRFHGLSRWFGILWPYVALVWLLGRLLAREPREPGESKAPSH